jgi:hypothetical protein
MLKKIKNYEKKMNGETTKNVKKEYQIKPGMPGSGPQMHKEIIHEILKNHPKLVYPSTDAVDYDKAEL